MFQKLISKTVTNIYMNEEYLRFKCSDDTIITYTVEGDCCSQSYFHDFIGIEELLNNKIISITEIPEYELSRKSHDNDYITNYGYAITFMGRFGEQTAVVSFRNSSNGYYGGRMKLINYDDKIPEIKNNTFFD